MGNYNKTYCREPEDAFKNAIDKGLTNPEDYMYMYTKENHDYFKHIDTRNYISFDNNLEITR